MLLVLACCHVGSEEPTSADWNEYYDYSEGEGGRSSNYEEWWGLGSDNATDVTELCSGVIDTNSSIPINSSANSSRGDYEGEFFQRAICLGVCLLFCVLLLTYFTLQSQTDSLQSIVVS